jgi:hypothetical protein
MSDPGPDNQHLGDQIDRLAKCLMAYYPDEPGRTGRSEGAVDVAIRLLEEHARMLNSTYCAFCNCEYSNEAEDTLEKIQEHVLVCQHHPMRLVERDRDEMDRWMTQHRVEMERLQKLVPK